jgi:hypothetical protein
MRKKNKKNENFFLKIKRRGAFLPRRGEESVFYEGALRRAARP